jgi:hypothetical protein
MYRIFTDLDRPVQSVFASDVFLATVEKLTTTEALEDSRQKKIGQTQPCEV